jgi:hypothetical protein
MKKAKIRNKQGALDEVDVIDGYVYLQEGEVLLDPQFKVGKPISNKMENIGIILVGVTFLIVISYAIHGAIYGVQHM